MSISTNVPVATGTYTSNGVSQSLAFQQSISKLEVHSLTKLGLAVAPVGAELYSAEYVLGMSDGFGLIKENGAGTFVLAESVIQAAGFSLFDTSSEGSLAPAALAAASSISKASPAVVTSLAAHGLVTGDVVRIYGVSTLNTLNGLLFQVTVTGATTFTIPVDTTAQTSVGAGGFFQKIIPQVEWKPEQVVIASISQAVNAVVVTNLPHGFSVGEKVRMKVPSNFGMTQMDGLLATIASVPSTTSFTLDVDSSAFNAFALPQQAASFASTYAQAVPVGVNLSTGLGAQFNAASKGLLLGSAVVGASSDLMRWVAYA